MITIILFIISFSLLSVILTVYDKFASKRRGAYRIPEKILLLTALLGGAAAEFITMKIIRHKTKHKKFMTGLPAVTVFHIIIILSAIHFQL